jgi:hypothetical protein
MQSTESKVPTAADYQKILRENIFTKEQYEQRIKTAHDNLFALRFDLFQRCSGASYANTITTVAEAFVEYALEKGWQFDATVELVAHLFFIQNHILQTEREHQKIFECEREIFITNHWAEEEVY